MRIKYLLVALVLVAAGAIAWSLRTPDLTAQVEDRGKPELVIFWENEGRGHTRRITGTQLDMPHSLDEAGEDFSWNDWIKSIVVTRGTWRVYEHGRANTRLDETELAELDIRSKERATGWSCLVSGSADGPVQYDETNTFFAPDEISSIVLVSEENLPAWAFAAPR